MINEPTKHHRRSIRLKGFDYSQEGGYFVTIVTHEREPLFGEIINGEMKLNQLGEIVRDCWSAIPSHFTNAELGEFVVMPNHIHGIIHLFDRRGTIYRAPTVCARPMV